MMNPKSDDDDPSMEPHASAPIPAVRRNSGRAGAPGRWGVALSADEQRCFDQITASMRTLRVTRGRRSSIVGSARTCLFSGIVGLAVSIVVLGVAPLVVSFAGFVLALGAFTEFSQHAADSDRWRRSVRRR